MASADRLPLQHIRIDANTNEPVATVILLHGRGANEEDLLPIAQQLPQQLDVLSVRAPDQLGPGFTWYALDLSAGGLEASQPDPDDFDRSLRLLAEFVESARNAYDIPEPIGLLGFSQGAILGLSAMIEHEETFRWIVGLHGYLPERYSRETIEPAAGTPVFLGAGQRDEVIPATRARDAADRLAEAGLDVTFRTYHTGHTTSQEEVADVAEWLDERL